MIFRVTVLFACIAACCSHAVLPLTLPVSAVHQAPLVAPYPVHGYASHGLLGHGLVAKPLGHHILKRSPHLVAPLVHGAHLEPVAHVGPVAHVEPVAVSHQSRVDIHTAPVIPVVKPVLAPLLHAAPLLHKSFIAAPLHYGAGHDGHYASVYPHFGHY